MREEALAHHGRYHQLQQNLKVKEVSVGGRLYIVCHNPEEALRKSPKSLVGNRGLAASLSSP